MGRVAPERSAEAESVVLGRLDERLTCPESGGTHYGLVMRYVLVKVVSGAFVHADEHGYFYVVHGAPELPRSVYYKHCGTLSSFTPGTIHRLRLKPKLPLNSSPFDVVVDPYKDSSLSPARYLCLRVDSDQRRRSTLLDLLAMYREEYETAEPARRWGPEGMLDEHDDEDDDDDDDGGEEEEEYGRMHGEEGYSDGEEWEIMMPGEMGADGDWEAHAGTGMDVELEEELTEQLELGRLADRGREGRERFMTRRVRDGWGGVAGGAGPDTRPRIQVVLRDMRSRSHREPEADSERAAVGWAGRRERSLQRARRRAPSGAARGRAAARGVDGGDEHAWLDVLFQQRPPPAGSSAASASSDGNYVVRSGAELLIAIAAFERLTSSLSYLMSRGDPQ